MKDKIQATIPTLRAGLRAVLFLLKLTTLFVMGLIGMNIFSGKVPAFVAYALAAVFAWLGAFAVDGVLDKVLPLATTIATKDIDSNERKFKFWISIVAYLLLIISGTLSWWAMPEISHAALSEQKAAAESRTDSTVAIVNQFRKEHAAEVERKAVELRQAQGSESARIRKAKAAGHEKVEAAINAGPPQYAELWRAGNSWIRTEKRKKYASLVAYRTSIERAKADSAAMVNQEAGVVAQLRQEKSLLETARGATVDSLTTSMLGMAEKGIRRYENRIATMTNILLICDIAWMLLALGLSHLIGLVDGHEFKSNRNAISVLFEVASNEEQGILSRVEWWAKKRNSWRNSYGTPVPSSGTPSGTPVPIPVKSPPSAGPAPGHPADVDHIERMRIEKRLAEMQAEIDRQAEQARMESEQARREAEQSKLEAEQLSKKAEQNPSPGAEQNTVSAVTDSVSGAGQITGQIVVEVVRREGKAVIKHMGRDGEKYYTLSEVQGFISKYRKRADEAKTATAKRNNQTKLELFRIYEKHLKDQV